MAGADEAQGESGAPPAGVIREWDALLLTLLKDLVPRTPVDAVAVSFVEPTGVLLETLRALRGGGLPDWAGGQGSPPEFAAAAWRRLRERVPEVACFPLGPAVERATKRCFLGLARAAQRHTDPDSRRATLALSRALLVYTTLWLFELAMVDLRGSSRTLRHDFGFLYHFLPSGRPRSLRDESELRRGLLEAARRLAQPITAAWLAQPSLNTPDPRVLVRALQHELSVPFGRAAGRPGVAVLGLSRQAAKTLPPDVDTRAARHIFFHGSGTNGRLELSELVAACGGGLDPRVADLLDIAATVYLADIHVPRDAQFARSFGFVIGVRRPELWTRHADALARQLSFLSLNPASLRFVPLAAKDGVRARPLPRRPAEGCASLFSGGLDSFAGAAQLVSQGRRAFLVSHDPGAMVHGIQRRLARALGARRAADGWTKGEDGPVAVSVPVRAEPNAPALNRLGNPPAQVLYQYTRSFLFLSLATAVALQNGLREVLVFENGSVALNPAFSEARTNTRTTHPLFLAAFERLVAEVFEVELKIRNPFELMTKGEVLAGLEPRWHESVRQTNSCWSYSKVKLWAKDAGLMRFEGGHCGRCLPCVWRRAALRNAQLARHDDAYLWDHLPIKKRDRWGSRTHLTVLLDQLRFCRNVLTLPTRMLLELCPDLLEGQGSLDKRLALVRRFSREVVQWFQHDAGSLVRPAIRHHLSAAPDRSPRAETSEV